MLHRAGCRARVQARGASGSLGQALQEHHSCASCSPYSRGKKGVLITEVVVRKDLEKAPIRLSSVVGINACGWNGLY